MPKKTKKKLHTFQIECKVTTSISRTIKASSVRAAQRMVDELPRAVSNDVVLEEWNQDSEWVLYRRPLTKPARYDKSLKVRDFEHGDREELPEWLLPAEVVHGEG